MKKAIFPGSFDPITMGHIDIIKRISSQYDEFTVLVANSTSKKYLFSLDERIALIKEALANESIIVQGFEGLTVDYAKQNNIKVIVRGLRAVSDFEYEKVMANMNKKLYPEVETVLSFSDPNLNYVSSSMIKEVFKLGGDLTGLIPSNVIKQLKNKFN